VEVIFCTQPRMPNPPLLAPCSAKSVAELGFVGDVGDLAKVVQAAEGVGNISDAPAKLAHELAD
jgi:hypothetical protein